MSAHIDRLGADGVLGDGTQRSECGQGFGDGGKAVGDGRFRTQDLVGCVGGEDGVEGGKVEGVEEKGVGGV